MTRDMTTEIALAQRDEALDAITALLRLLRGGEYTTTPQQRVVRAARALLAEHGRIP